MPYLIAMGTDPEPTMKNKADQQLVEIDKKYSGFIHVSGLLFIISAYRSKCRLNSLPLQHVWAVVCFTVVIAGKIIKKKNKN